MNLNTVPQAAVHMHTHRTGCGETLVEGGRLNLSETALRPHDYSSEEMHLQITHTRRPQTFRTGLHRMRPVIDQPPKWSATSHLATRSPNSDHVHTFADSDTLVVGEVVAWSNFMLCKQVPESADSLKTWNWFDSNLFIYLSDTSSLSQSTATTI